MTIPKKIKVGGMVYTVSVQETIGDDIAGVIVTEKQTIKLLKSNDAFMHVTLLHELLHAINMEMPEERIEFLAQALYQIIVDNPSLFGGGERQHGKK